MHASEWEQSNVYTSYPFDKAPPPPDEVKAAFVDAVVQLVGKVDRVALHAFSVSGASFSMTITMGGAAVVQGSGTIQTFGRWGIAHIPPDADGGLRNSAMLVLNMEAVGTSYSMPGSGYLLAARCAEPLPSRVNTIIVDDQALTGRIVFAPGYNMRLDHEPRPDAIRGSMDVVFTAQAGAGEGREPADCPEAGGDPVPAPLLTINGVRPLEDGSFFFRTGR